MAAPSVYTNTITLSQAEQLHDLLEIRGWEFKDIQHALWQARGDKAVVVAWKSGKLTVQGKGLADFVQFTLEPEILKEFGFGYGDISDSDGLEPPEPFVPHGGVDESGKGDFFGPLVIVAVYADDEMKNDLLKIGVKDSKTIKSDKPIYAMTPKIKKCVRGRWTIVSLGNPAYNRFYAGCNNLNKLLAWGHARAIENLLERAPECQQVISDKFAADHMIKRELMEKGRCIELIQRTKAESDPVVAAASILAREGFIRKMSEYSEELGIELPRGASAKVIEVGKQIYQKGGNELLSKYAKMHFSTAKKVAEE
jgi:ribonuclease HIII